MIKELAKLFAVFGVLGGIAIGPGLIKNDVEAFEPNLDLPTVGTYENFKKIVEDSNSDDVYYGNVLTDSIFNKAVGEFEAVADSAVSGSRNDYSTTNVQVSGVDEADIVKTDGKYLYHIVDDKILISDIYPSDTMKIISIIRFDNEARPVELYVEDDMAIVVCEKYNKSQFYGENFTEIKIYNIKDRAKPEMVKEIEVSGNYNSSRRIGESFYLVAQKYIRTYELYNDEYNPVPIYRDSKISDEFVEVGYENIRYFPEFKCSQYMITVGVDLSDLDKEAQVSTYLGNSESIYASEDNMYITFSSYKSSDAQPIDDDVAIKRIFDNRVYNTFTSIYRFKLEDGQMNCKATGEVKGKILNQFSMDEKDGYFRIATTIGDVTGVGENISKNNMYVLDNELNMVGSIEDIAPGEKIYSVRFMNDRAYMVTFRKVDPLFVIDLANPENPTILGKLKIPGYSDYLHPYDENHIIGFGKDADVVSDEDGSWGWADESGTAAYYQGMKIALFDVTDPTNPIEMWKEEIGDRGTESELLNNHKALLFSKDKKILAFPIRVATVNQENRRAWTYGDTTFVGAYVYELTLDKGFVLKAKLTNLTEDDWKKLGGYYYGDKTIDRLIYIDDILYTISDYGYSAYDMSSYEKINELKIN